jgi:aminoglycoside/choline kinase family phosphotransferase
VEDGVPATLVVKLPSCIKEGMEFADSAHAYEREIRFYREVAPRTSIRVPRIFATIMDPTQHAYILVMEDLKDLIAGDQVQGMSRAQIMSAVRTIAPLHAAWWNGDQRKNLPWVPCVEHQLEMLHLCPDKIRQAWPHFLEAFGDLLQPDARALGDRIIRQIEAILAKFVRGTRTLVHFDYRADNLFIDEASEQAPIVGLDWQLAMWGLGAYDIARLAGGSILPAERGGHHDEIVNCWHDGLLTGGVTDYSIDAAWHDYRVCTIVAMLNPVLFYYMFKTGGPRGTALGEAMTTRFFFDLVECGAEAVVG